MKVFAQFVATFLFAISSALQVGAQFEEPSRIVTIGHLEAPFTLSKRSPKNVKFGVRLISIARDGTTIVEQLGTGWRLTAKPGCPFKGPPEITEIAGGSLVLSAASYSDQSAQLLWFKLEYTTKLENTNH